MGVLLVGYAHSQNPRPPFSRRYDLYYSDSEYFHQVTLAGIGMLDDTKRVVVSNTRNYDTVNRCLFERMMIVNSNLV
jgi:hypothetical protein